jgi:hypothetical protein
MIIFHNVVTRREGGRITWYLMQLLDAGWQMLSKDSTVIWMVLCVVGGSGILVYSGDSDEYTDIDPALQPYTQYQYRVVAYNAEGQVTSDWDTTRTQEAPPVGVFPPIVQVSSMINLYIIYIEWVEVRSLFNLLGKYKGSRLKCQRQNYKLRVCWYGAYPRS